MKKLPHVLVIFLILLVSCENNEKVFYATDGSSWPSIESALEKERRLQEIRTLTLEKAVITKELTNYEAGIIANEYTNLYFSISRLRKHIRGTGELKRKQEFGKKKTYKASNNEEFFTQEEAEEFDKLLIQLESLDRRIGVQGIQPLKGKKSENPVGVTSMDY